MSRQYGRMPRNGRKASTTQPPGEIRIVIPDTYTVEQFALEIQRALARLQDYGATGLVRFRTQLMPLDENAEPMTLRDEAGQVIESICIPETLPAKPYRDNEPGIGVLPATPELISRRKRALRL